VLKHSRESQDKIISGQLQGIINQDNKSVEITYSYPWPAKDETQPVIIIIGVFIVFTVFVGICGDWGN
jgi:hypothetical protein